MSAKHISCLRSIEFAENGLIAQQVRFHFSYPSLGSLKELEEFVLREQSGAFSLGGRRSAGLKNSEEKRE